MAVEQKVTAIELAKELITSFEGSRLKAYKDTNGIWTIGYGHTKDVIEGMIITKEQEAQFLTEDLADSLKRFNLRVTLNAYEKAALISLAFNLTWKSYKALEMTLNVDKEAFKERMLLYCRDTKGNFIKGLKIRRIAERLLFENREWKSFKNWTQKPTTKLIDIINKEKELFNK
ncbi:MAG: lysozyme [Stygiobacter sp.]